MAYGIIGFEMQKTTVYLDPEILRGLRAMSRAMHRPQAELIREALSQYLDRAADYDLPPWVGSWKLGPETDAATIKHEARSDWAAGLERGPG